MTTWHPPIPAGKLYSEPALALGPGLAMLVWCYDRIDRNGTIEIKLEQAAADIGKPYGTIKDWWRLLRRGPFFCEQIDRGKRGWAVRMTDDWLDWHVMRNNYPGESRNINLDTALNVPSSNDESRDVSLNDDEGAVKEPSRSRQSRDVSFENPRNKVLQRDQNPESVRGVEQSSPPALLSENPSVALYTAITGIVPERFAFEMIVSQVTNPARWEETIKNWLASGFKPGNVKGMLDWYNGKGKHQQNGHTRAPVDLPLEVRDPNKKRLPVEERRRIMSEVKAKHDTS